MFKAKEYATILLPPRIYDTNEAPLIVTDTVYCAINYDTAAEADTYIL